MRPRSTWRRATRKSSTADFMRPTLTRTPVQRERSAVPAVRRGPRDPFAGRSGRQRSGVGVVRGCVSVHGHTPVRPSAGRAGHPHRAGLTGSAGVLATTQGVFTGVHQVEKRVEKPTVGDPARSARDQGVVQERPKAPNMLGAFKSCTCVSHLLEVAGAVRGPATSCLAGAPPSTRSARALPPAHRRPFRAGHQVVERSRETRSGSDRIHGSLMMGHHLPCALAHVVACGEVLSLRRRPLPVVGDAASLRLEDVARVMLPGIKLGFGGYHVSEWG